MPVHDLCVGRRFEWNMPSQYFIDHAGEAIKITALAALAAAELFRCKIGIGSDHAALGQSLRAADPSDTKIHNLYDAAVAQHQVGRFYIAMDHPHSMSIAQA